MTLRSSIKGFLLRFCRPLHDLLAHLVWKVECARAWKRFATDPRNDPAFIAFLRGVYDEANLLLLPDEAKFLHEQAAAMRTVTGEFAEVGVYRGGSAKIICDAKGDKNFHAFDTFEGLPEPGKEEQSTLTKGQFSASYENACRLLSPYSNVHIIKGVFPESAVGLQDMRFAFVHLDVDLYAFIKAGLEFFWERLSPGGTIVVHDVHFERVRSAIDEFIDSHPGARLIRGPGNQCALTKPVLIA